MKNRFNEKVKEFKRQMVRELLRQCTAEEQNNFYRIYNFKVFPNGIDSLNDIQLKSAYDLCHRTIDLDYKEFIKE